MFISCEFAFVTFSYSTVCSKSLADVDLVDAPGHLLADRISAPLVKDADAAAVADPSFTLLGALFGALDFDLDFARALLAQNMDVLKLGRL